MRYRVNVVDRSGHEETLADVSSAFVALWIRDKLMEVKDRYRLYRVIDYDIGEEIEWHDFDDEHVAKIFEKSSPV